jgi:NAD-dependent DNA ligase
MITETDQLATALNQAANLWPELSGQRTLLLRKILEVGIESIGEDTAKLTDARLANIQKLAGSMDDVWPSNWKEELAEDWPI